MTEPPNQRDFSQRDFNQRNPSQSDFEVGDQAVLGMDNIALDLPIAGLGSRVLAAGLDYTILTILMFAGALGSIVLVGALDLSVGWAVALVIVVLFAIEWGYFIGSEVLTRGRTLGKMAVRLRVVGREGGTASASALLVRNLVRFVDLFAGVPLIATDPAARRLGDRLAGTLVVHDRPAEAEVVLGKIPDGWGAKEVAVAESFLRRSPELQPGRRRYLARRLLALVERDAPEQAAEVAGYSDPDLALRRALRVSEREGG